MEPYYNPNYPFLFPGLSFDNDPKETYLSGLDSDTRDYVLKHTNEYASREDLEECVYRLKHDKF